MKNEIFFMHPKIVLACKNLYFWYGDQINRLQDCEISDRMQKACLLFEKAGIVRDLKVKYEVLEGKEKDKDRYPFCLYCMKK